MKVLLGAAAAALLLASPAHSQAPELTSNCTGFPPGPSMPDGATANHEQMTAAGEAVQTWRIDRDGKLAQCLADINALRAQLNALEGAYNAIATERNNLIAAWNQEVTEFNDRGGSSNRRQRGVSLRQGE
jgi:hypothetical protein